MRNSEWKTKRKGIRACPSGAGNYHSEIYEQVQLDFEKLYAQYGIPETFYVEEEAL